MTDGPLTISGDPDRLQQVLWNLLSNAVKFTPAGGRVTAAVGRVESHLEVTVKDTGIGIEPDFLPFVFEPFRQADSSTTRTQSGLGLGLAIARHLVELHGGTIGVESDGRGRGTTFRVALPLRAVLSGVDGAGGTRTQRVQDRAAAPADALKGLTVLVVDDEADARGLVEIVLTGHGARVMTAGSAAEALARLHEHVPHVLLADIGMPGEDGYSLIQRIRSMPDPRLATIPAVALTAYGRDTDRHRALAAGFQQHIAKPAIPEELVAVILRIGVAPQV